jgi:hypothetical protein
MSAAEKLRPFGVIDIADEHDQKIAACICSTTCNVSTNSQHPVDNLSSDLFKVTGTLLRTCRNRTKWVSEDSEHCPFETDRLNDMENTDAGISRCKGLSALIECAEDP